MKRELRKLCQEVIAISLNSDQVTLIAQEIDSAFDVRQLSGFGNSIAIPGHAAAGTLLDFLSTEERIVEFIEKMFLLEGKFLYDSTFRIAFKEDLLVALEKSKWIFDADTKRIFRDRFYAENLNFLRGIELIELLSDEQQKPFRVATIADSIRSRTAAMQPGHVSWQVTMRLNRLSGEIPGLMFEVVSLLLRSQGLESLFEEVFGSLQLLAVEARNRVYESVFVRELALTGRSSYGRNGATVAELFKMELEENGDTRLSQWAEETSEYFDLHFKSSEEALSCWTITHLPMTSTQKKEFLATVDSVLSEEQFQKENCEIYEASMHLQKLTSQKNPLRIVFYPGQTKLGFFLKREDLACVSSMAGGK